MNPVPPPPPEWRTILLTVINSISMVAVISLIVFIRRYFSGSYSNKMITHIAVILVFLQADQLLGVILIPSAKTEGALLFLNILNALQIQLFMLCQVWTVPISIHAYKIMAEKMKFDQKSFYKKAVVCVYIFGLLPMVGSFAVEYFLPTDGEIVASILITTYYIYLAGSLILSIVLYFKQKQYIEVNFNSTLLGAFNIKIGKLTLYPLFSLVVFTPYFLSMFRFFFQTGFQSDALRLIIVLFYAIHGTLYLLFYVFIRNTARLDLQYLVSQISSSGNSDKNSSSMKITHNSISLDLSPTKMLKQTLKEEGEREDL